MTHFTDTFFRSAPKELLKRIAPVLAAASFIVAASWSNPSSAANYYGAFCLKNHTGMPINFEVKIGRHGVWRSYTIVPGTARLFWHRYDYLNEHRSPITFVRFDADLKSGSMYVRKFSVTRNGVSTRTCRKAQQYRFIRSRFDDRYITMVSS